MASNQKEELNNFLRAYVGCHLFSLLMIAHLMKNDINFGTLFFHSQEKSFLLSREKSAFYQ